MHGKYGNETIDAVVRGYLGPRYQETVANALMYGTLHSELRPGDTTDTSRDLRVMVEFRIIRWDIQELGYLAKDDPKKFRELLENPSWWVEAESVKKLVEKLRGESS